MVGRRLRRTHNKHRCSGFTLIELMYVVGIIGILAVIAIPGYQDYTVRARVAEGLDLAPAITKAVQDYYDRWGTLPKDNAAAGLPLPAAIRGRSVDSVTIEGGVILIRYGKVVSGSEMKTGNAIMLTPYVNTAYPTGSLRWVCGLRAPGDGFTPPPVSVADVSLVPDNRVPTECRS